MFCGKKPAIVIEVRAYHQLRCNILPAPMPALEASWRRVFEPVSTLLFDLYHFLEQNRAFGLVPEHASGPSSQVLHGCRVRHQLGSKKVFVLHTYDPDKRALDSLKRTLYSLARNQQWLSRYCAGKFKVAQRLSPSNTHRSDPYKRDQDSLNRTLYSLEKAQRWLSGYCAT